jgi:hypothetical protein
LAAWTIWAVSVDRGKDLAVESTAMIEAATKAHVTAIPVIQYLVIVFPPKHPQENSSRDGVPPHFVTPGNDL